MFFELKIVSDRGFELTLEKNSVKSQNVILINLRDLGVSKNYRCFFLLNLW